MTLSAGICRYCERPIQAINNKDEICVFCQSVYNFAKNNPSVTDKIFKDLKELQCKKDQ
jgi:hypothetical protein